ncbi:MAG: type II secretion system F family protein [Thermoanaerobacterales bacterium]|nr:type II secretion system F family protein [Thermoanaerobacterales bacterium]
MTVIGILVFCSVLLVLLAPRLAPPRGITGGQVVALFAPLASIVFPDAVRLETQRRLTWAGLKDMRATDLLGIKLIAALGMGGLAALSALGGKTSAPFVLLAVLGYILPDVWLGQKMRKRQEEISRRVPDFAVLLATVLDAGGGDLQGALVQVGRRMGGVIGEEIEYALHEMSLGIRRARALQNLADRCGVAELTQLVQKITQAEFYGSPVAVAVRDFAEQVRTIRQHNAEKKVREQTVKMLVPMLFFTVPALLALFLYPALRQIGQVLRH